ncbi:MAG TPA: RtcB family protein, partial [Accumulibacter sp.]|nr:RtcB family protein [Accumulibacter sp.]
EAEQVWLMLHSGSRGVGNAIGSTFIELAQADMRRQQVNLPDRDLAYLEEGSRHFADYVEAVGWAQDFARCNRQVMMNHLVAATRQVIAKPFTVDVEAVNCHHNYVQKETHFGNEVYVTRKGAVSARRGELGIIPGSMGARSYIVRGLGNTESFCSCSHGAGRTMSRSQARRQFTVADQERATAHVECRKDSGVIDENPMAYKDIDAVMHAQRALVEVVHTLRQVVCVKG